MRSNLKKCVKKWMASVVSVALVFSMSPVSMSKVAEAEGIGQQEKTESETVRNVCFGAASGIHVNDIAKVVFSVSEFDKRQNVSSDDAKVGTVEASQKSWVATMKTTDDSLEARLSDTNVEKITAVKGYDDYSGYDSKIVHIEHKSGASVLSDATQTSAVIADITGNVIYYGKLNDATADISDFILPKGLAQGKYKLYVFAEKVSSYTDSGFKATATDRISDIGEPIEIEVLDSLNLYVELDWPEFNSVPDTTANIYISKDNNYSETVSGSAISWSEGDSSNGVSNEEIDVFEFNRNYTANISLQTKEELYMSDNVKVFFGNRQAQISYLGSGNLEISYTFDKITIEKIIIGGEVKDGEVVLNAYFDTSRPVKVDASKYDCKWYLGSAADDGSMNDANCNLSEYRIGSADYNSYIKVEVSINGIIPEARVTSVPIKVTDSKLNVDFIVGVNKNNETYKAKEDGVISGMKSGMVCTHVESGESIQPDGNGMVSGLAAGQYKVSIDTSNLQTPNTTPVAPNTTSPAYLGMETELNEVYAEYVINEGRAINVGFNSAGGSDVSAVNGLSYGDKINKPVEPVRVGYSFKGWYKDWQHTVLWDFDNDTVQNDITLHAKWEKNAENSDNTGNNGSTGDNTGSNDNNTGNNGNNTGNSGSTGNSSGGMANYPTGSGGSTGGGSQSGASTATPSSAPSAAPSSVPTTAPNSTPVVTPAPSVDDIQSETPDVDLPDNAKDDINNNESSQEPVKEGEKAVVDGTEYTYGKDNTVEISGQSTGVSKKVTIPDTVKIDGKTYKVTKISSGAYSGTNIESVTLGNNIKTIGTGAFKDCKKLTSVSFSSSLTTIGKASFKNCTSLKNVSFPSNIRKLGNNSFENCTNLSKATLPSSVKTVGMKAFKNCKSLKKFTIGKAEVKKASSNKKGLKRGTDILLTGTEGLDDEGILLLGAGKSAKVSIGASALENCVNLRSVIINSQVTKIGNSTFQNCVKLASILVKSLKLKKVGNKSLKGVSNCKISVPSSKFKPYSTLFKNKGQGKKVVIAKS